MIFGIKQYRIEITDTVHTDWPSNFLILAARTRWAAKRQARLIFEQYPRDYMPDYKKGMFKYRVNKVWRVK